ncbi:Protein of unknown function [Pyronema omphalodes CBS 100304]|uniref:Uncharacterized protein n=1 Tax=Pyronema omphalodes (strain CBS 100304) TaxID=1076935 RepID=U4KV57_PYROM|nr:Protein of unknown function [Pyronema omphalodes CBS 100304]
MLSMLKIHCCSTHRSAKLLLLSVNLSANVSANSGNMAHIRGPFLLSSLFFNTFTFCI